MLRPTVRVRTAATLPAGMQPAAQDDSVDIALIDYRLAGENGLAALSAFGRQFPLVARVLITARTHVTSLSRRGLPAQSAVWASIIRPRRFWLHWTRCSMAASASTSPRREACIRLLAQSVTQRQLEVLALIAKGA